MADAQKKELDAFFAFLGTFGTPIITISDLNDGAALFKVLQVIDAEYFRQHVRSNAQMSDNWVLRFNALKRLFRLMTQYFADVLQKPTSALDVPDLQAMAKDSEVVPTLLMCRLTIAIAVHSEQNKDIIEKIQNLKEEDQHCLMRAIEQVMSRLSSEGQAGGEATMTDDDHFYQIQSDRSRILREKETLQKVYETLLEGHRSLQTSYDDAVAEKEDAVSKLGEYRRQVDIRRNEKADVQLRGEIDKLRTELQKSEDNLTMAETELDKHQVLVVDLRRKVDELQSKADEAAVLKDRVDEYRHAADKLQKTENVMEKYKKKLEESADLRRRLKALEEQNASLVDKNASLEEEYRKVSGFKPLLESYKSQIADLEAKGSTRQKEIDTLKFELEQSHIKLKIVADERAKDTEALELYQERVRELELMSVRPVSSSVVTTNHEAPGNMAEFTEAELLGPVSAADPDADHVDQGLGGELNDAISGTTMTDLKLQIRKLKRDLEAAQLNKADASRIMVLENLLDDANRTKARYEADYLAAHREKLVLQRDLEEIRSGKALGDGSEAAIALRRRLNETVEQYDTLQKAHAELQVDHEQRGKELTIAKSDLNLVNKDQLEILASLRETMNEEKKGLEVDLEKLKKHVKDLSDKNKMQLEQVNGLLMEKVSLQSDSIGQREKMLERERNFSDLRASIGSKDIPEDVKGRLLSLHDDNIQLKEQLKATQERLSKAKAFIKNQDKLFKAEHSRSNAGSPAMFDEIETIRAQLKLLEEEVERQKRLHSEATMRYRREQEVMLGALHGLGLERMRRHLNGGQSSHSGPSSWLGQQRHHKGLSRR